VFEQETIVHFLLCIRLFYSARLIDDNSDNFCDICVDIVKLLCTERQQCVIMYSHIGYLTTYTLTTVE